MGYVSFREAKLWEGPHVASPVPGASRVQSVMVSGDQLGFIKLWVWGNPVVLVAGGGRNEE